MVKDRNCSIELLRVLLILFVVGFHVVSYGTLHPQHSLQLRDGSDFFISVIMEAIFVPAVNCFILISGFYSIKAKLFKFLRLYQQVFFYSTLITIAVGISSFMKPGNVEFISFTKSFFPIITNQWWFFSSYTVLFLLSPYINNIISSSSKRSDIRLFCILFFFLCIAPSLRFPFIGGRGFNFVWFIFIYITGMLMKKYDIKLTLKSSILYYAAFLMCIIGYSILLAYLGRFKGYKSSSFSYDNIFVFFESCSLFCLFLNFKIYRYKKVITSISSAVFGIYLFHEHPLIKFQLHRLFKEYLSGIPLYAYIILTMLGICTVGYIINKLRVFVPNLYYPFLKKIILVRLKYERKYISRKFRKNIFE